jgi:hypothetical protein
VIRNDGTGIQMHKSCCFVQLSGLITYVIYFNLVYLQAAQGYRGRLRGLNKSLKSVFGRQRRSDQHSKQAVSLHPSSAQKIMQSHVEVHESVQETAEDAASQKEGSAEPLIKNGPENCSSHEEGPKDEILVKVWSTLYRNIIFSEVFQI